MDFSYRTVYPGRKKSLLCMNFPSPESASAKATDKVRLIAKQHGTGLFPQAARPRRTKVLQTRLRTRGSTQIRPERSSGVWRLLLRRCPRRINASVQDREQETVRKYGSLRNNAAMMRLFKRERWRRKQSPPPAPPADTPEPSQRSHSTPPSPIQTSRRK